MLPRPSVDLPDRAVENRSACQNPLNLTDDQTIAGPTPLNTPKNLEEKVGVPGGLEAAPFDALTLDGLLSQDVEGNLAEHRDVLGRIALTDAALTLRSRF